MAAGRDAAQRGVFLQQMISRDTSWTQISAVMISESEEEHLRPEVCYEEIWRTKDDRHTGKQMNMWVWTAEHQRMTRDQSSTTSWSPLIICSPGTNYCQIIRSPPMTSCRPAATTGQRPAGGDLVCTAHAPRSRWRLISNTVLRRTAPPWTTRCCSIHFSHTPSVRSDSYVTFAPTCCSDTCKSVVNKALLSVMHDKRVLHSLSLPASPVRGSSWHLTGTTATFSPQTFGNAWSDS